jgi:hypothetical protein
MLNRSQLLSFGQVINPQIEEAHSKPLLHLYWKLTYCKKGTLLYCLKQF